MAGYDVDLLASCGEPTPATAALWKQAESDLCFRPPGGRAEPSVWEHAVRIACLSLHILRFPELRNEKCDRHGLLTAALYHELGWILQLREGRLHRTELLVRPTSDEQRELAAAFVQEKLARLVPENSLRIAAAAIREQNFKTARLIESQVLVEAHSLDDVGLQAVCLLVRRHVCDSKGLDSMLEAWDRQREYRYWEARLKDGFRFDTSRRIARDRLRMMERFMSDLRRCHRLEDVRELLGAAPAIPDASPSGS